MSLMLAAPALLGGCYSALARAFAPGQWEWGLLLAALVWILIDQSPKWRVIIVFFALGFLSCHFFIQRYLAQRLQPIQAGNDVQIAGVVRGGVSAHTYGYGFDLEINDWQALGGASGPAPPRLRIHWYQTKQLVRPGDRIEAIVRIKPPRTRHSGAGFNEENYALVHRLYGSGYIRQLIKHENPAPLDWRARIERRRFALSQRIADLPGSNTAKSIVNALANGDRASMSNHTWQLLNRTGTSHLMAISGLHIGMFALCIWRLLMVFSVLLPGIQRRLQSWPLVCTTLSITTIYALFCGMSLPTQRALIMLAVFLLAHLSARAHSSTRSLLLAFILVVLWHPATIVTAGLWLSFCAVACLLLSSALVSHKPAWFRWLHIQGSISLFLLPVCFYWFGQSALSANLANLIAIPMVCFVILPVVWSAVVCDALIPGLAQWLFALAFELTDLMIAFLQVIVALPQSYVVSGNVSAGALLAAWVGLALVFLAPIRSMRAAGLVLCLPLLTGQSKSAPEYAQLQLSMIDVGQGLAVLIQSQNHTLLYDTGPGYGNNGSAGGRIIAPWIEKANIARLDSIIVSHFDNDHAGGLADIVERIPTGAVISNDIEKSMVALNALTTPTPQQSSCLAGQRWNWDGVRFEILWPTATTTAKTRNNRSCVLLVSAMHQKVLLLGDIDQSIEAQLLTLYPELRANILVVAHHGSQYSTHSALLASIQPELALISSGYLNRWNMPAPQVRKRLQKAEVSWLSTAQQGTITTSIESNRIRIGTQTGQHRRYWHRASTFEPIPCHLPFVYNQCMKSSQPAAGSPG